MTRKRKGKKLTILDVIQSKEPFFKKKIFWEKWKFNQLPKEYRKTHREEYRHKLLQLTNKKPSV